MNAPEKFPSYKEVQKAKKGCYPKVEDIKVTSISAGVTLQSLLDHTVKRLFMTNDSLQIEELDSMCCLYTKCSFGHSSYKQAFLDHEANDSGVLITSIVPLRLVCAEKLLWQNPRPASTRYCRPAKIEFAKESLKVSVAEKKKIDN